MTGKLIMTALMLLGLIKPQWLIKITEFWKLGRKAPTDKEFKLMRIMCAVAIVFIWFVL